MNILDVPVQILSKISVFIVGIFRFPVRPILEFKAVVVCGTCCIVGNFRQLVSVVPVCICVVCYPFITPGAGFSCLPEYLRGQYVAQSVQVIVHIVGVEVFRLCRCVFFASARFFLRCRYRFPLSRLLRKSSSRLSVVFLSDSLPGSYSDMPVRHLEQHYGLLPVGLADAVLTVTELVFVEYI